MVEVGRMVRLAVLRATVPAPVAIATATNRRRQLVSGNVPAVQVGQLAQIAQSTSIADYRLRSQASGNGVRRRVVTCSHPVRARRKQIIDILSLARQIVAQHTRLNRVQIHHGH